MIWEVLPDATRASAVAGTEAADPASDIPDASRPRADLMLALIARIGPTEPDMSSVLHHLLDLLAPDPEDQRKLLRMMIARLSYPVSTASPAPRQGVIQGLEEIFNTHRASATPSKEAPAAEGELSHRVLTRHAGLVLFHPFYKLLFDRLQLLAPDDTLAPGHLSRGRATLAALAGAQDPQEPLDPLARVLLGLPRDVAPPPPTRLDEDDEELIDGLIRSVITQWSKLGQTSPAGLQDAFIRRGGQLRFDDAGAHLRVDPGPFDMLLDGLPWALDTMIALPWMPVPCHVIWRAEDG